MFRVIVLLLVLVATALSHPLDSSVLTSVRQANCTQTCTLYERLDTGACECISLTACDSRMRKRREYREVPAAERAAFVRAVKQLNEEGIWGQLAQIHDDDFDPIHSEGNFFPWHTGFLFLLESLIMDRETSVQGLPYFQWGAETNTRESTMWGPNFMGMSASTGGPILDGPFENFAVGGTAVTRNFNAVPSSQTDNLATIAAVIANRDGVPFWVGEGMNDIDVSDELEVLHDRFHVVVGGTMLTGFSPQDPVFFLHHAFVDKWWAKQWPAAGGFSPTDGAKMLEGLPLTRAFSNLGGFTLQNSVDIQTCVEYVEPVGAALRGRRTTGADGMTAVNVSLSQSELEAIATFERKPAAQVSAIVSGVNTEVALAAAAVSA